MRELGISNPRFIGQFCAHDRVCRQRREIVAGAVFARTWFMSVPCAGGRWVRWARAMIAIRERAGANAARTSPDGSGALRIRRCRPLRGCAISRIQASAAHTRPDAAPMDTRFRRPLSAALASPSLSASARPALWTYCSKAPSAAFVYPYRSRKRRPSSARGANDLSVNGRRVRSAALASTASVNPSRRTIHFCAGVIGFAGRRRVNDGMRDAYSGHRYRLVAVAQGCFGGEQRGPIREGNDAA